MLEKLIVNGERITKEIAYDKLEGKFFKTNCDNMLMIVREHKPRYYVQVGDSKYFRRAILY